MIRRVFYSSGPGNIIESHHHWKQGTHNPSEVSVTFSKQIEDFCRDIGAAAYLVSTHADKRVFTDEEFVLEHRPKPLRRGLWFHLDEIRYGLGLLRTARRFHADVALIDSGSTHFFLLALFRLCGIVVVPILHNTLWPSGHPPSKLMHRLILQLDRLFWNRIPAAVLAVSPECARQLEQVRSVCNYPVLQIRAQFLRAFFQRIGPAPAHETKPFRVMYIGRIHRVKGVFDILEIARQIEDSHPGLVRWEICGGGVHLEELQLRHKELRLQDVVVLRGWTSLDDLVDVYTRSHASIVPTRSSFTEGLAMTAAEAILAGRPLVTNPVVPALEILPEASVAAATDDVSSHRDAVLKIALDRSVYERACAACSRYQGQFYDRSFGLAAVLKLALAPYLNGR